MNEVIFTCGGSVANNIALLGSLSSGDHFITSSYEHPAILNVIDTLRKRGVETTLIKPEKNGLINPEKIEKNLKNNTKLISIMYINNEIGTINPIKDIAKISNQNNILFHTDAVQAMGKLNLDVRDLNINFLSLAGHKFYGPKGVGVLYVKEDTPLYPIIFGGGQESHLFPGTENIVNIGAMGLAAKICTDNIDKNIEHIKKVDSFFLKTLDESNIEYTINGENRIPGIINITLHKTKSPSFIINLDKEGYGISAGSACASGSIKGSNTLKEIDIPIEIAEKSYRISFGKYHSLEDVESLVQSINKHIKQS
tara:strand:- start:14 stop:946 length:933 start_codon:yes stop_codon:yes gene_type:complete